MVSGHWLGKPANTKGAVKMTSQPPKLFTSSSSLCTVPFPHGGTSPRPLVTTTGFIKKISPLHMQQKQNCSQFSNASLRSLFVKFIVVHICLIPINLKIFYLQSLQYRRLNLDLVLCYKIVSGSSDILLSEIFHFAPSRRLPAHHIRLAKKCCTTNNDLHSFQFRVLRLCFPQISLIPTLLQLLNCSWVVLT